MRNVTKGLLAAVVAIGSMSAPALADSGPRYVLKRISNGPRADRYVFVRVADHDEHPRALTGERDTMRERRPTQSAVPTHPKGPRSQY
jgi:hypothetical protein